ncbi:MAG TPA: hypothetical protein ENK38_02085 [Gammaproteobacteria bacterium]|nr:hypothetical protein [Gammaproteobacteria bacterium]
MLTNSEIEQKTSGQVLPRLTKTRLEGKIRSYRFVYVDLLTICVIELHNGFTVNGESACVSPGNYDRGIGEKIAYDNAFRKLWLLEGYLLQERLYQDAYADGKTPEAHVLPGSNIGDPIYPEPVAAAQFIPPASA